MSVPGMPTFITTSQTSVSLIFSNITGTADATTTSVTITNATSGQSFSLSGSAGSLTIWASGPRTLNPGQNIFIAIASNAQGNSPSSAPITITTPPSQPTITTTSQTTTSATFSNITGTATAFSTITLTNNGGAVSGSTTAASNGSWTFAGPITLTLGTNNIVALATNVAGSSPSSSQIVITRQIDNVMCFKEHTKILTNKGYVPIQDLRKGDLVKTLLNDYKPIYMIGKKEIYHPACNERIKDQLYECSPSKYTELFEPLIITGCHSILVDDFKDGEREKMLGLLKDIYVTDHKYRLAACVDERTIVYKNPGTYTIYHVALENDNYYMNYGVYANGLLVETCSQRYLKELSNMNMIE